MAIDHSVYERSLVLRRAGMDVLPSSLTGLGQKSRAISALSARPHWVPRRALMLFGVLKVD
jgi:hypothetical protein